MAKEKQGNGNGSNITLALADAPSQVSSAALVVPEGDALAFLDQVEIEDDGLGQVSPEDIKLAVKVFNSKTVLPNGDPVPDNQFFDTVTEQISRELHLVWIKDHQTNEWRTYDDAAGRSVVHCSSPDRITGTMADGAKRPCAGCPDAQWGNVDGKRTRNCGPVHNMFAVETDTMQPCVVRFRRTSLTPIQTYLSRYHYARRSVVDKLTKQIKRVNVPLFAFTCKVTLKMSDDKKYAIPVIERGSILDASAIQFGQDQLRYVNAVLLARLPKVIEADQSADESTLDTSFDTSKMSGGHGQDFVDPTPPPAE